MSEPIPIISVVMPVYNGMPYLPIAVESVLSQTFRNFELVIVDDCSTDSSRNYLETIVDDRLVLVTLEKNRGVTGALQEGVLKSRGKYIARLDADDMALPERLQTQFDLLESDQNIGLVGSSLELIDKDGQFQRSVNLERSDLEVRWKMLFRNPFCHSTVMFRRDLLQKHGIGYSRKYGEDYQLWVDMIKHCKTTITKDRLIYYRSHNQSWTFTRSGHQQQAFISISGSVMERYVPGIAGLVDIHEFVMWVRGKGKEATGKKLILFAKLYAQLVERFADLEMCGKDASTFREHELNMLMKRVREAPTSWAKIALMAKAKYEW